MLVFIRKLSLSTIYARVLSYFSGFLDHFVMTNIANIRVKFADFYPIMGALAETSISQ